MADRSDSPRSWTPILLLVLLPVGLGAGWLVGKIPGEAPAPKPVQVGVKHTAESVRAAATAPASFSNSGGTEASSSGEAASPQATQAPVSSPWMSYDAALAESNRTGKPILLDFNAEWCPPCQALKREVFDDGSNGAAVQLAVIPVSVVDRKREDGNNPADVESLQNRFGVEAFPTLVVFHPATGRKVVARGFGDAGRTTTWIQQAAAYVK